MDHRIVRIVFFSGTGCTTHVAETFKAACNQRGAFVQMHELRHDAAEPKGSFDYLLLCYPVHAANAPRPVMEWIRGQEITKSVPAAVISVSGGGDITPNLACRVAVKRRLSRKGFLVRYERMLVMPSNWIVATKPALAARLLEVLPERAGSVVDEFLSGGKRRMIPGPGNRLLSLLGKLETPGARLFGKRIRADEHCIGCGLCARECPVANIDIRSGRPVFGFECVMCLRCLYLCPQKALRPGLGSFVLIKEGFRLDEIKKLPPLQHKIDIEREADGLLWLGLKRYLLSLDGKASGSGSGSAGGAASAQK